MKALACFVLMMGVMSGALYSKDLHSMRLEGLPRELRYGLVEFEMLRKAYSENNVSRLKYAKKLPHLYVFLPFFWQIQIKKDEDESADNVIRQFEKHQKLAEEQYKLISSMIENIKKAIPLIEKIVANPYMSSKKMLEAKTFLEKNLGMIVGGHDVMELEQKKAKMLLDYYRYEVAMRTRKKNEISIDFYIMVNAWRTDTIELFYGLWRMGDTSQDWKSSALSHVRGHIRMAEERITRYTELLGYIQAEWKVLKDILARRQVYSFKRIPIRCVFERQRKELKQVKAHTEERIEFFTQAIVALNNFRNEALAEEASNVF